MNTFINQFDSNTVICIQYSVISLICTVSLIYFIVVTNRSAEHSPELFFYKLTIGFAALCSFTDILFAFREYAQIPLGDFISYLSEILYSLGSICGAYCWFLYSEKKQQSVLSGSPMLERIFAVPFLIMCLFTVTTPLHGLCFSLSGSQYVRGVLNIPFTVLCSAFILYSGISSGISSFRKKLRTRTVLLRLLLVYAVLLILAQLLQILLGPVLPFRSLAATVVFLFITLRGMCETVTIDALTNINNRFSFDRTLEARISEGGKFWLLMFDIDNFKHINDTYGHVCGDEAIRHTASAIVRALPSDYFAARYGGDEFAVVAPHESEAVIASAEESIRRELQKVLRENGCPFSLDLTAGYAESDPDLDNIPDLVAAADKKLYEKKRLKKQTQQKTS